MTYLKAYLGFLLTFLLVDAVWISLVAQKLYLQEVGHLMAVEIKMVGVAAFYLFYAAAVVLLAIKPALNNSGRVAFGLAAVLGGVAYGTFSVTNYAILEGWTLTIVVSDVLWGMFVTGLSAWVGHWLVTRF